MKFSELPVGAVFEFIEPVASPDAYRKRVKLTDVGYRPKEWGPVGFLIVPNTDMDVRLMCTGDTATCEDMECLDCGERECPQGEPLHFHHDGCPARCGR